MWNVFSVDFYLVSEFIFYTWIFWKIFFCPLTESLDSTRFITQLNYDSSVEYLPLQLLNLKHFNFWKRDVFWEIFLPFCSMSNPLLQMFGL